MLMMPKFKPEIIDTIEMEGRTIGKIAGINLKDVDLKDENDINAYLKSVKSIMPMNFKDLYIEGQEKISKDIIETIEEKLHLNIEPGYKNKIKYLPHMIQNIFKALKEEQSQREFLIIGRDPNGIKEVAVNIADQFKFISIYGMGEDESDDVYEYVLEKTGASIFVPTDLKGVIKNYSVIINLDDSTLNELHYRNIKKGVIFFDFGTNNREFDAIQDFEYKIKNFKSKQIACFAKAINSSICEGFKNELGDDCIVPSGIISRGEVYEIDEYIKLFIRFKGKF